MIFRLIKGLTIILLILAGFGATLVGMSSKDVLLICMFPLMIFCSYCILHLKN